jgi:hypothetical protein
MKSLIVAAIASTTLAVTAQAGDIYGGIAYDLGRWHTGEQTNHGTLILGYAMQTQVGKISAEVDLGAGITGNESDYSTTRLRGLYTLPLGSFDGLASLGGTMYNDNGTTHTSVNFGIGAEKEMFNGFRVRGEAIRDLMQNDHTPVTVLRLGVVTDF